MNFNLLGQASVSWVLELPFQPDNSKTTCRSATWWQSWQRNVWLQTLFFDGYFGFPTIWNRSMLARNTTKYNFKTSRGLYVETHEAFSHFHGWPRSSRTPNRTYPLKYNSPCSPPSLLQSSLWQVYMGTETIPENYQRLTSVIADAPTHSTPSPLCSLDSAEGLLSLR